MKKLLIAIAIVVIIVLLAVFGQDLFGPASDGSSAGTTAETAANKQALEDILDQPLSETYSDETYKFTFSYPAALTADSFHDDTVAGDVVTVADVAHGLGLQIIITPFDEDLTVLTVERIKKDQPTLTIIEPRDVILGASGKGVAFIDSTDKVAAQRQIWFIAGKHLYQITAPLTADELVQKILNGWKFL